MEAGYYWVKFKEKTPCLVAKFAKGTGRFYIFGFTTHGFEPKEFYWIGPRITPPDSTTKEE